MRVQLLLACLITSTVFAADIPKIMDTSGSIIKYLAGAVIDKLNRTPKQKAAYKATLEKLTDFLSGGGRVAQNALDLKDDLPKMKTKAELLNRRMKCLDHAGEAQCSIADIGCTNEEACIAKVLEALVDLLEPMFKDLVGKREIGPDGKVTDKIDYSGALLSLVTMMPKSHPKREQYMKQMLSYVDDAALTIEFVKILLYSLNPASLPKVTNQETQFLAASIKSEPVEFADEASLEEFN
jgi:hypothetical protein